MSKVLFSKFCNCLKTKKTIAILPYTNIYLKVLILLFREGLIRGFYFEYVLNKKYIIILLKHKICSFFTLNLTCNFENNFNLSLFIFTTNCGILVNVKQKKRSYNKNFYLNVL